METIFIDRTKDTPEVELNPTGEVFFKGRAMPEHPVKFFQPIIDWSKQYDKEALTINMKLEYFNTSVSKSLLEFFKIFEKNRMIKDVTVNWHYEEGDDDTLESGEIYQDLLPEFTFHFHEYEEEFLD